jgi:thermitase
MSVLYSIAFIAALFGLLTWILIPGKRIARFCSMIFFASLAVWVLLIVIQPVSNSLKLFIAFRDLVFIGVAAGAIIWSKSNKIIALGLIIGLGIFIKIFYFDYLRDSFRSDPNIPLDTNGELLVELSQSLQEEDLISELQQFEVRIQRAFEPQEGSSTDLDDYFLIDIPEEQIDRLPRIEKVIENIPGVDWVERNESLTITPEVSEETQRTGNSFGLNDPYVNQQWALGELQIEKVHQILSMVETIPQKKALIAILDTGIDGNHEDLRGNYQSTKTQYDIDKRGHGTHVAGIACAVTNNRIGIASLVPNPDLVTMTSIKVFSDLGFGSQHSVIAGMIEAADKGADVISMSLGGRTSQEREVAYTQAVEYCQNKGAIVVVAAGNAADNAKFYAPANIPGVITVSAVNDNLSKASFSNHISDLERGIAAPGDRIFSTYPNNQYRTFRGTSMATPYVSGLVGIMKSLRPELSTDEVYNILHNTGKRTRNSRETGRFIQPGDALDALMNYE